jgi:serine phosphatase RsbU (regulator of sigma subunit)
MATAITETMNIKHKLPRPLPYREAKGALDTLPSDHAKLQQAVYEAAQVQRRLCAPRELVWREFEIAGEIFPVRHLSGDFFKVMELGSVLGLTVGDIAGKGLSAGIWQAHVMNLVQRYARKHLEPADVVAEVNLELSRDQSEPPIVALFFARLDADRGELVYCNAGLPSALLLRSSGFVERLEEGGPMLGALEGAHYKSGHIQFDPGDMLLTYSDGLTECRNSLDEEFEMARLISATSALRGASANQVLFSTLGAVLDFADACTPTDDLTLLVVRRSTAASTNQPLPKNSETSLPLRRRASHPQAKKAERRKNRFR